MNRKMLRFCAALLLSCFFLIRSASARSLPLKHYSVTDGLASSSVYSIFQDAKGFLWIGTEHGLSRFDGREFQSYYIRDGLPDEFIIDIWEDREGNIWFGTFKGGICVFKSGRFKSFRQEDGLINDTVHSITGDREGNLWVGTHSGVSKFDAKNFTSYTEKSGLSNNIVYDIVCDKKGDLWFATFNGLSCFRKGQFLNYNEKDGLKYNVVKALMVDSGGSTWIGTTHGLSCLKEGKFISYTTADGLANNTVNVIIEDKNHNIWIGTDNGISYFSSGKFTNFTSKNGLPGDKVHTIFEDREGNIWIGTKMGLSRLHSLRIVNFSVKDGLPNNLTWAILEEREGKYWFGTNKGLSCYEDGKFKNFNVSSGLASNNIYALMKDSKGKIWIGTGGGVSVYAGGKFSNYFTGVLVLSLAEDRAGVVWIGTNKGLCRFSRNEIIPCDFEQAQEIIHALLIDKKGNLWFSNMKGLCQVKGDKITFYSEEDGLINNNINSLLEDSRGRIWIATNQGLSCLSKGKFVNYTSGEGLSDNVCYFVLEDDNQNIWIGTTRGVNLFDGKSFKTYTSRDGLTSDEMAQKACLKDSQGNLWFGTVNGITRFNPKLDRVNTVPPPVYITRLNVFDKEQPLSGKIQLEHNRNYLGFSFIGVSFTSPEDVTYKYRLEKIEREWFEKKEPEVSYPYLPPGKYTFQVIAKNNDGIESAKPAELKFRILPPFWATWWFRGLLIVTLLSLIVMIVLWRLKRLQEKMADEARNKQLVMAQKMELVGILAGGAVHDLKNLLSIIIGYSKIAVQNVDRQDEKSRPLEKIKNTAMTAVSVVKQILAFSRQKYDKTMAANLADLLDDILEILKITTPPEIKIVWQPPQEEIRLFINPTKFQQVVMNLCLNAIQAIPGEGEVLISLSKKGSATPTAEGTGSSIPDRNQEKVSFFNNLSQGINKKEAGQIILEIADSGIGMEEEVANKIFDPLFTTKEAGKGTGLGLFVVKQIVDEQKGKIKVTSKPGEGTVFKIIFPPA